MATESSHLPTPSAKSAAASSAESHLKGFRPPAVPLVACDPFFSIWSAADRLTDKPTSHWTGKPHRLTSLVRIDGRAFRVMGDAPQSLAAITQVGLTVHPTRSVYAFEANGVRLEVTFTTPLLPDDLLVCSRPASYITWTARSIDGKPHEVAVYFDAAAELAVNTPDQAVVFGRERVGELSVLQVGSEEQPVLQSRGDDHRIDWGHFYAAAPAGAQSAIAAADVARAAFAGGAALPADVAGGRAVPASEAPVLAFALSLGVVGEQPASQRLIVAYDDEFSIRYFHQNLRAYWRRDGATAADLIAAADRDYESLVRRCEAFDAELVADLRRIGGESYVAIGALSWRQALAAQKICADDNGQPLMFSKENYSNGCIATVDVLYPAAPQMLIFAPSMLKASLVPLLDYSSSPLWTFDSAPHDLGQYPQAVGQIYGGESTSPMPVEESGNMLVLLAALAKTEGNADFAARYWPTLTTWKNYLVAHGLDPENQLCTDDFAGHIARNANLSIKAIMGIASYGLLAGQLGRKAEADEALATARDYARKWMALAADVEGGTHYQLVFGEQGRGTWSQKYNLVWDSLLDLNLFPKEVARTELAYYAGKMNRYGLPLDSRKAYTKLDWEYWTATMAESDDDFRRISDACATWASETASRVPMTDWYETDTGKQCNFQARSVVGGVFIGLMRDRALWQKYARRDTLRPSGWAKLPIQEPPTRLLLPTAKSEPDRWKFIVGDSAPAGGKWMSIHFDDTGWASGKSGFGATQAAVAPSASSGAASAADASQSDRAATEIYLRREFDLPAGDLHDPQVLIHHDEYVEVYINGVLATRNRGQNTQNMTLPVSKAARAALRPGKNVLAVRCKQAAGKQNFDVGLVDVLPMPRNGNQTDKTGPAGKNGPAGKAAQTEHHARKEPQR